MNRPRSWRWPYGRSDRRCSGEEYRVPPRDRRRRRPPCAFAPRRNRQLDPHRAHRSGERIPRPDDLVPNLDHPVKITLFECADFHAIATSPRNAFFLSRRLLIARFLRASELSFSPSRQSKLGEFVVGERDRIVRSSARRVFEHAHRQRLQQHRKRGASETPLSFKLSPSTPSSSRTSPFASSTRETPDAASGHVRHRQIRPPRPPCGRALDHVASTLARAHRGLFGVFAW